MRIYKGTPPNLNQCQQVIWAFLNNVVAKKLPFWNVFKFILKLENKWGQK